MLLAGKGRQAAHYIKHHLKLDVNMRNLYSHDNLLFSALQTSCHHDPSIILELIGEGLDVNSRNGESHTPLMIACAFLCVETVQILLNANADPCAVCNKGRHAAFYVGKGHYAPLPHDTEAACQILHMLYSAGTPMHATDNGGSIALFQKTLLLNAHCVALLGSFPGFNVHHVDPKNGYTALHYLMEYGAQSTSTAVEQVMSVLITRHGLDVNLKSKIGLTPLMIATNAANATNVQLLLCHFKSETTSRMVAQAPRQHNVSDCMHLPLFHLIFNAGRVQLIWHVMKAFGTSCLLYVILITCQPSEK